VQRAKARRGWDNLTDAVVNVSGGGRRPRRSGSRGGRSARWQLRGLRSCSAFGTASAGP